ncbi:MAG: hypothetical protein ACW96N_04370 [Candidatus Thorarchaeota archaeon]
MPLLQFRTSNLGKSRTGLAGTVGYVVLDEVGTIVTARTTAGIFELTSGSGMYGAHISFPDDFKGSVVWDSGETPSNKLVFANEEYNYQSNNPNVDLTLSASYDISGSVESIASEVTEISSSLAIVSGAVGEIHCNVEFIKDIEGGRWKINTSTNQMIFFKNDNSTEIARFNLFDSGSNPTSECVFERVRTGAINEC